MPAATMYRRLQDTSAYRRVSRTDVYKRLGASPFFAKIARYSLGSGVALATSAVVFAVLLLLGERNTTIDSVAAFFAGAVPNWILNRRWAWEMTGRVEVAREVIGYAAVTLMALVCSSLGTSWAQHWVVRQNVAHGFRAILVTASYVLVQILLFVVKFVIYDRWVFAGRSRFRAALRSRHQVWVAARANRTP
jgi:putative flippase GtrA